MRVGDVFYSLARPRSQTGNGAEVLMRLYDSLEIDSNEIHTTC